MSLVGYYQPGRSVLHRTPPGLKLAAVVLLAVGLALAPRWWQSLPVLAAVLLLYASTRLGVGVVAAQLRALLWVLVAIALFQLLVAGWRTAVDVDATMLTVVLAAGLVTLTTTTTALTEVLVRVLRPLRRVGVDPDRLALLVSLSLRSVPVVLALAREITNAQRARGLTASPRAFAVPLLVRSLRHAQRMGEALAARGFDD